jgi:hypothetical protein
MIDNANERQAIFADAVLKTAEQCLDRGELGPLGPPMSFGVESLCLVLGGMLAAGDASSPVWLAGRDFCGKLLDNIPNADSYEVCALLREAIEDNSSVYDNKGIPGLEFFTQEYQEYTKGGGALALSN